MLRPVFLALIAAVLPHLAEAATVPLTSYRITASGNCLVSDEFDDDSGAVTRKCAVTVGFSAPKSARGTSFNPDRIEYGFALDGIGQFRAEIRHGGQAAYYWYDDGRPHCGWDPCGFVSLDADGGLRYLSTAAYEGIGLSVFGMEWLAGGQRIARSPDVVATDNDWPTFLGLERALYYTGLPAPAEYWLGGIEDAVWTVSRRDLPPIPLPATGLLLGAALAGGVLLRRR